MKLPISQILSESWDDLTKLIVKPVILLLILVPFAFSYILGYFIPSSIEPTSLISSPTFILTFIILMLLMSFISVYLTKLVYNLKKEGTQNIFSEVLSVYPRFLWYMLILASPILLMSAMVIIISYFKIHLPAILGIVILLAFFVMIYLVYRLFFVGLLVIIDKDKKPIATSWGMTKGYFWGFILMFIILFLIAILVTIAAAIITGIATIPLHTEMKWIVNILTNIIFILPFEFYMTITFINAFLFLRPQPKLQPVAVEEPPIN